MLDSILATFEEYLVAFLFPQLGVIAPTLVVSLFVYIIMAGHPGWRGVIAFLASAAGIGSIAFVLSGSVDWVVAACFGKTYAYHRTLAFSPPWPAVIDGLSVPHFHWGWRILTPLFALCISPARRFWSTLSPPAPPAVR